MAGQAAFPDALSHPFLIIVSPGSVNMPVACGYGIFYRLCRFLGPQLKSAISQAGDLIAIVPQEDLFQQIQEARAAQAAPEELEQLYGAYQAASMIYTPVSGRVVDLVETGSAIQTGDLVVGITNADSTTNEAEIRAYVPSTVAQSIKKGMEVRVYPSASGADSYGYVQGLVSGISSYPITETDISETLGRFYTSIVEIRVTLLGGSDGTTGAWSRAEGGSLSIDTGTLCEMEVIVDEMTPWEYLRS